MLKRIRIGVLFCAFFGIVGFCGAVFAGSSFDIFAFEGPKTKDLYYITMPDTDSQLLALLAGKLDVLSDIYRPKDVERLAQLESVKVSVAQSFHGFYVTFNTRKFPWDQTVLRQAASQVVERERWTQDLFSHYSEPVSSFLPPLSPYYESVETFPAGVEAARKRLADAGWTWNREGWLVAPDGREAPVTKILCPPSTVAATSAEIALRMAKALISIGVRAEADLMDFQSLLERVHNQDFDACTNAWSMSRDPDNLFSFYHSSNDVKYGYNLSGIADPQLDAALYDLRYAPDEARAREAISRALKLLSELMPAIPIYSRYSISAARADWDGLFVTNRVTIDNLFTLISMSPKQGGQRPIYWNIPEEIRVLNPLTSSTAYDWTVLSTIYDTLISVNPENFEDMPWLAESWGIHTEGEKTVLTFTLRPGLKWQDGRPLTAEDAAYTLQFIKAREIPRFYERVKDIESITVEKQTLRVVMANTSFWHLRNIGGMPILPKHILENVPDWQAWQPTNRSHAALDGATLTELVGTGPFIFRKSRTGEYVHMSKNEYYFLSGGRSARNNTEDAQ
ncbi:MAG: ABC transporter substrate-binding protein [Synergistaceae bacterium]|jgi:peptide/nickel transport system substrate-binding protein|nr:ABC transporter substrate-binding protein [Synergistaceae bacterium]